jgi:hypothetical protein
MRSLKLNVSFVLGVIALVCTVIPALHASDFVAPEIDANSLMSGLTLASAAALMFRARRRAK